MSKKSRPLPSYEQVSRQWRYNPETGKFYWKIKPLFSTIKPGDEAGGISGGKNGKYWRLTYFNRVLLAHRVAWLLHHKQDPGQLMVDHINGNGLDNRISNLRLATRQENCRNRKLNKNNSTGYKGVHPSGRVGKPFIGCVYHKYRSQIIGYFETAEEAAQAVKEARRKLYGQFYSDC